MPHYGLPAYRSAGVGPATKTPMIELPRTVRGAVTGQVVRLAHPSLGRESNDGTGQSDRDIHGRPTRLSASPVQIKPGERAAGKVCAMPGWRGTKSRLHFLARKIGGITAGHS